MELIALTLISLMSLLAYYYFEYCDMEEFGEKALSEALFVSGA